MILFNFRYITMEILVDQVTNQQTIEWSSSSNTINKKMLTLLLQNRMTFFLIYYLFTSVKQIFYNVYKICVNILFMFAVICPMIKLMCWSFSILWVWQIFHLHLCLTSVISKWHAVYHINVLYEKLGGVIFYNITCKGVFHN